ncbi:MAG TPA: helix-turn-helix domain-containing protein [Candidatus Mediterraneibacter norfolkensis]|nr:helix-turn-helix domain-containing protein [Candidatus Mediterraneibacter norfolkensis]
MFESLNTIISSDSRWITTTPTSYTRSLPFYLLEWGHFIAYREYFAERRNSNRFLLFYTISGSGKLLYDGKEYILTSDRIAIIQCNAAHRYETYSDQPWNFYWFHYNGTAAHIYYNLYNTGSLYFHEIKPESKDASLIKKITRLPNKYDLDRDLTVSEWITNLMTTFILEKRKNIFPDSSKTTEKLNLAIQYMSEHLTEKISVTDIASSAFLSTYHFVRSFKKQMGLTPYEYLITLRINKAKDLLISTEDPLDIIAVNSGFTDSKNLIYNFKRIVSLTPGEYRKSFSLH